MDFGLNENQVILRDSAREFFAGECPMASVRRAAESPAAYDAQLWAKLAAQGYTGIIVDEAHGGVGLGIVELVLLMEEAGRALLPGPLFATVAMAGAVLDACAHPGQKHQYLAPIAHGHARSTLAFHPLFIGNGFVTLLPPHLFALGIALLLFELLQRFVEGHVPDASRIEIRFRRGRHVGFARRELDGVGDGRVPGGRGRAFLLSLPGE